MDLLKRNPSFAGHLWEKFSSDVMDSAYEELRSKNLKPRSEEGLRLFSSTSERHNKTSVGGDLSFGYDSERSPSYVGTRSWVCTGQGPQR